MTGARKPRKPRFRAARGGKLPYGDAVTRKAQDTETVARGVDPHRLAQCYRLHQNPSPKFI